MMDISHETKETLDKVEYLRSKADISYEEALSMLERFDGDLTRVLIELERANRIRPAAPQFANCGPAFRQYAPHSRVGFGTDQALPPRRHRNHFERVVKMLFHNNLQVTRDGDMIMNLPVICYIVLLLFAPHITIIGVVLILLFGCHIGMKRMPRSFSQQDVADFASHAVENVHSTINNISENIRKGFDNTDRHDDNNSGEGGEFTVD
ncbi:hypothetical protein AGMMS49992_14540 [Clostridia bacterium]|nr:hypothetical protein AGMMS49992_14540 [Clostridia bacterium]